MSPCGTIAVAGSATRSVALSADTLDQRGAPLGSSTPIEACPLYGPMKPRDPSSARRIVAREVLLPASPSNTCDVMRGLEVGLTVLTYGATVLGSVG